jgi:hypothetical protein
MRNAKLSLLFAVALTCALAQVSLAQIVGDRSQVEEGLKATNIAPLTMLDLEGNSVTP